MATRDNARVFGQGFPKIPECEARLLKKILSLILIGCLVLVVGCSSQKPAEEKKAETKLMKIGSVNAKDRSLTKGMVKFGEIVEKETGGAIKVQVFSDGVLGGDRQTLEGLQMGHHSRIDRFDRPDRRFRAPFRRI